MREFFGKLMDSKFWRPDRDIEGKVFGWILWQKEEESRKGFNGAWILIHTIKSFPSIQFKDIQEVILLIHCCKTMHCYWMTSPSTSTTSGKPTRRTPFFKVDRSQGEKVTEGTDSHCSSQPWTRWILNKIGETSNTIWTNPESPRSNTHLKSSSQNSYLGAILKLAQRKGLRFYQTRSHAIALSNTQPATCTEKVVCMKSREELTAKDTSQQGHLA